MLSRVVSSAYMMGVNVLLAIARSLMYSRGPRIDPSGTPVIIVSAADWVFLIQHISVCCICSF